MNSDQSKKGNIVDTKATGQKVLEDFLGVRILTPLEEGAISGGIKPAQDHDHDDWGGHTHDHN